MLSSVLALENRILIARFLTGAKVVIFLMEIGPVAITAALNVGFVFLLDRELLEVTESERLLMLPPSRKAGGGAKLLVSLDSENVRDLGGANKGLV